MFTDLLLLMNIDCQFSVFLIMIDYMVTDLMLLMNIDSQFLVFLIMIDYGHIFAVTYEY